MLFASFLSQVRQKTRTAHTSNPVWNHNFEFDERGGGEYLKIKCYSQEMFGDDSIGCARVNLEGLVEGSVRDVWVPLEKVNSGEIRLRIEVFKSNEGSRVRSFVCVEFYEKYQSTVGSLKKHVDLVGSRVRVRVAEMDG